MRKHVDITNGDADLARGTSGRVVRAIRILTFVCSGSASTANEFASRLSVSRRTVFRDIQVLREAGVPIVNRPGKGYTVPGTLPLAALDLQRADVEGLLRLVEVARRTGDGDRSLEAGIAAVRRIVAHLPPGIRPERDSRPTTRG